VHRAATTLVSSAGSVGIEGNARWVTELKRRLNQNDIIAATVTKTN
jgi:hypothetical protein